MNSATSLSKIPILPYYGIPSTLNDDSLIRQGETTMKKRLLILFFSTYLGTATCLAASWGVHTYPIPGTEEFQEINTVFEAQVPIAPSWPEHVNAPRALAPMELKVV